MARTRRNRLGIALALGGLLTLALGAWSLAQLRITLARGPMLIEPFGIAVSSDGAVLVGIDGSRVHVYDAHGTFLRSWDVLPQDLGADRFRIQILSENEVQVATERSGRLLAYDLEEDLTSDRRDPEAFERFGPANDFIASGPSGERYSIESGALVRLRPTPQALLVPKLRWPLALLIDSLALVPALLGCGSIGIFAGLALTTKRADPR